MLPCCVSAEQILNIIVFETYTTFSFVRFVSVSMQVHKNAGLKSHVQFDFLFWGDESHFVIFNIFFVFSLQFDGIMHLLYFYNLFVILMFVLKQGFVGMSNVMVLQASSTSEHPSCRKLYNGSKIKQ